MAEVSKPRYRHDCGHCRYLGQAASCDVYFCPTDKEVILRGEDRGEAYRSLPLALLDNTKGTHSPTWELAAAMARDWISS